MLKYEALLANIERAIDKEVQTQTFQLRQELKKCRTQAKTYKHQRDVIRAQLQELQDE